MVFIVEIGIDDDDTDEVSVELKTLFIVVVVSISIINEDVIVSIEVSYECDIVDDDDDEYGTEVVSYRIVLSWFPVVELEVSYVLEVN
jgi:hypothetical protein